MMHGGPRGKRGAGEQRAKDFRGTMGRLLGEMGHYKKHLALVALAVVLANLFSLVSPRIIAAVIDVAADAVMAGTAIDLSRVGVLLLCLLGLYLCAALFQYIQQITLVHVTQSTMYDMRARIDAKLTRLPLSYFDRSERGDILSRATNDVDNIASSMQQSVPQIFASVVTVIGVLIMMLSLSPMLTLISLALLPLTVIITMQIMKRSQKLFARQWAATGALGGHIEEMYSGHLPVKLYGKEADSLATFHKENDALYDVSWKAQFLSGIMHPLMSLMNNFGFVVVCVLGALRVIDGRMSVGGVTAFITYNKQLSQPITQVAQMMNMLQSAAASAERVFELLDEPDEEQTPEKPGVNLTHARGEVRFEHVDFGYVPEKTLICDMNLTVKPGQMVAIVGPTGAGKTTLVNLIMRFYELNAGRITLDGEDISTLSREQLRAAIGMVLQDAWLFSGTIGENIAYGKKGASDEQIRRAAKAAHVDHFIRTLEAGYDTQLSEDADNISQGQRQLLTIARTLLSDPPVLILDEATSSVDTRTEVLIQKAMKELMAGRTSFVIAHRLSTIRDADVILVMRDGSIIETGTHAQLMEARGFYYELYSSQFEGNAA